MASFVVMKPPVPASDGQDVRFIRDGFSFWALILPFFWLLWHRLWIAAAAYAVIALVLAGVDAEGWGPGLWAASAAITLLVALEGQNLRVAALHAKGWTTDAVVDAETLSDAEALYFGHHVAPDPAVVDDTTPSHLTTQTHVERHAAWRRRQAAQQPLRPQGASDHGIFDWYGGR
jgi:hypothetical protein